MKTVLTAIIVLGMTSVVFSQTRDSAIALPGAGGTTPSAQEAGDNTLPVPDGDQEELHQFLKQVEEWKTEASAAHQAVLREAQEKYSRRMKRLNAAGKIAAERIMEHEDGISEAVMAAADFILPDRFKQFSTLAANEQRRTIAMARALLESRADKELNNKEFSLARTTVRALEGLGDSKLAAETCRQFEGLFQVSSNPQMSRYAEQFASAARQHELVGQPFQPSGANLDGTSFDWSAYRERYVLIDYRVSPSGFYRVRLKNLKKYYRIYHNRGFDIVSVSRGRDAEQLKEFVKDNDIPWVVLHDQYSRDSQQRSRVSPMLAVSAPPAMLFVDRDGLIVSAYAESQLRNLLIDHLGGTYGKALPFVLKRDWHTAAELSKEVQLIDLGLPWSEKALAVAVAQLLGGDVAGYQETCQESFERSATSSAFARYHLAVLCYLAPNSGISTQQIGQMIDSDMSRVSPVALATMKGMHEFRSGNYEAAMESFPQSGGDAVQVPAALLLRAMTAEKLGDTRQAQELLQQGVKEMETRIPKPDGPPIAAYLPDCWVCWGQLQVLRREAEGMIGAPAESK